MKIELSFIKTLSENLRNYPDMIQVILGPRQVGKTTGILEFLKQFKNQSYYYTADETLNPDALWIEEKWQDASLKGGLLVIDEIQKVPLWSSIIKKLWDKQKADLNPRDRKSKIKLVLLGSSSLDLQTGLTESLTGRFMKIRAPHWGFADSVKLSKMSLEEFILFGGYPGSYQFLRDKKTWQKYMTDSIVETVIGKDILNLARVAKPALFKQAFQIIASYPAQEISYTKLLGQLQDKGNTDLIKHYIELYEGAFLFKSIQKYSKKPVLRKSSSPKIIPLSGALINREVLHRQDGYQRAFEACVGAALVHSEADVYYWREKNSEVDYVCELEGKLYAIEVKSGKTTSSKGMQSFLDIYKKAIPVFITEKNLEFFLKNPIQFLMKFE